MMAEENCWPSCCRFTRSRFGSSSSAARGTVGAAWPAAGWLAAPEVAKACWPGCPAAARSSRLTMFVMMLLTLFRPWLIVLSARIATSFVAGWSAGCG